MVREVSAMFVASIHFRAPGGAGVNIFVCSSGGKAA